MSERMGTEEERGEGDERRGLEVEEEFDLVRLGFASASEKIVVSCGLRTPVLENQTNAPGQDDDLPPAAEKPQSARPSLGLLRHRSSTGRYASADWTPRPAQTSSGSDRQVKDEPAPPPIERVISRDFAAHPIPTSPDTEAIYPPAKTSVDGGSITPTPSLASGILTSTETATTTATTPSLSPRRPRSFSARLTIVRRPGRGSRLGIRIIRKPLIPDPDLSDLETQDESPPPLEALPKSQSIQDVVEVHGRELYARLKVASKLHSTCGDLLPELIRDLLPALSDRKQALGLVNKVRTNFALEPLSGRVDRVALQRALAQMRERLYLELASALILPLAPPELPPLSPDGEEEDKVSMSMMPSSFDSLSRTLPKAFQADRVGIKAALDSREGMYGEDGDVVWVGGVGSMKRRLGHGQPGLGYRGAEGEGLVHVFVDHSNILYGLLHHLYASPLPLPPRHQRILSLPCLSLLLRRGRPTRSSHLVASSPLHQDLDSLVRLGWEVSILKRVEIYESEVHDSSAVKLTPKPVARSLGGMGGTRRYKEQGVDEILTLKMLQTINRVEVVKGSTIVLATGDARGGQFNQEGFLGAVREAVGRGWNVELWSFSSGLSRAWRDTARREKWDGRFRVHSLDEWAAELVEVNEDAE